MREAMSLETNFQLRFDHYDGWEVITKRFWLAILSILHVCQVNALLPIENIAILIQVYFVETYKTESPRSRFVHEFSVTRKLAGAFVSVNEQCNMVAKRIPECII